MHLSHVFVKVNLLGLYNLSEAVGKPTIHDFCEHTFGKRATQNF